MHRPNKWWWGVLPLAGLWAYTAATHSAAVEQDLTKRAGNTLAALTLDKPSLHLTGRDASLSADAFSPADIADAAKSVDNTRGIRLVNNNARLVPTAQTYSFSIDREGDTVTLNGSVPLPGVRQSILETVKAEYPSAKVVDNMTYALGAPADFEDEARFALRQLSGLAAGSLALTDGTLSVKGVAHDRSSFETLMANLKNPPKEMKLGQVNVGVNSAANAADTTPASQAAELQGTVLNAVRDGAAKTLTLNGFYRNASQHEEILAAAKRNFHSDSIVDDMAQAENAPAATGAIAALGLSQLSRLRDGSLEIKDKTLHLNGTALYEKAAGSIQSAVTGALPQGYTAQAAISVAPPAAPVDIASCQGLFNDIIRDGTIQFEAGSARIGRDSTGLLDFVVATAQRCPAGKLEIQGYTDADGSAQSNLALSQQRADAVKQYLIDAGVDGSRLTAVGYGQTSPLASNNTQDGKAQNRRIEFLVK